MSVFWSEPIAFLEGRYVALETALTHGRNPVGDIWWDKEIDDYFGDWRVEVGALGERIYVNDVTGETSFYPPMAPSDAVVKFAEGAELPLRKTVQVVTEENTLTKHGYKMEYSAKDADVAVLATEFKAASCIIKYARRKLAYKELTHLKMIKKKREILYRYFIKTIPIFLKWKRDKRYHGVSQFQAIVRGSQLRKVYFSKDGEHEKRVDYRSRFRLARYATSMYIRFKYERKKRLNTITELVPEKLEEWTELLRKARKPIRIEGFYEEYLWPGTRDIKFYRHKVTGVVTKEKPSKLDLHDKFRYTEKMQLLTQGYTTRQWNLAIKLQAMYRGFRVRNYYVHIEAAMNISLVVEKEYFENPNSDKNLWNYMLHCHLVLKDVQRARYLYAEALRRMAYTGPDIAFVLYAYSIFAFVTQELDYTDIVLLLNRARRAEEVREIQTRKSKGLEESQAIKNGTYRHGKIFELAKIGFFKHNAVTQPDAFSWHNYAACTFLIDNEFPTSFDSFLNAFRYDAIDPQMKANFDIFMRHFHGTDKDKLADIVRSRMQYHADVDNQFENIKRMRFAEAKRRADAATKIKVWYKDTKSERTFKKFIASVQKLREARHQVSR